MYDPIGNRVRWQDVPGTPLTGDYIDYTRNAFNQYEETQEQSVGGGALAVRPLEYDDDGNMTQYALVGDMNCDGVLDNDDVTAMNLAINDPQTYDSTYPNCDRLEQGDIDRDGYVTGIDFNLLIYHVLSDPDYGTVFEYDGENRLIGKRPEVGYDGAELVRYAYDYMGRRVEKKIYDWDDQTEDWATTPTLYRKFVYDGWRLVLELDGLNSNAVIRKYTWGLDLSGSLEGAGGIRGLLAMHAPESTPAAGDEKDYVYSYDAIGNVTQLLDLDTSTTQVWDDDRLAAYYQYRPFGQRLLTAGDYGDDNPFQFQTKYLDDETGFGYWGYRYYSFDLGRWINRDPIGEQGGANLYAYVQNRVLHRADPLGLVAPYSPPPVSLCGRFCFCPRNDIAVPDTDNNEENRQTLRDAGIDPDRMRGFEVIWIPPKAGCGCCGPRNVRLVQAIKWLGFWGSGAEFDAPGIPRSRRGFFGVAPPGMKPPGRTGNGSSFEDGPLNNRWFVDTAIMEVCAICTSGGSETNLGCIRFWWNEGTAENNYSDATFGFKWEGYNNGEWKFQYDSDDDYPGCYCGKADSPSSLWKDAMDDWNAQ